MIIFRIIMVASLLLMAVQLIPSCKEDLKDEEEKKSLTTETEESLNNDTSSDELNNNNSDEGEEEAKSNPDVQEKSVGGMPSSSDAANLISIEADDADDAVANIFAITGALNLGLSTFGANLVDSENGGGGGGVENLFQFASIFGMVFDMVANPAKCNFKLILKDINGDDLPLRSHPELPIYFRDGYGTFGVGDEGSTTCPEKSEVVKWAKQVGLMARDEDTPTGKPADDVFYLPTRLVIYSLEEGKIKWQIIFFPKDFIGKIAQRFPHFKGLVDNENLDQKAFYGIHEGVGQDLGDDETKTSGKGEMFVDWDALSRVMSLLQGLDVDEKNQSGDNGQANNEGDEDDEDMPTGIIKVQYDFNSDPNSYTVRFLEGFSFPMGGDNDGPPFINEVDTTIYRAANGENYMHFMTNKAFGDPGAQSGDPGPLGKVQICYPCSGGQCLFDETYVRDIAVSDYLTDPSEIHLQLLWKERDIGDSVPDDYIISLVATKGGPYIYGNIELQGGRKDGTSSVVFRMKSPVCDSITSFPLTVDMGGNVWTLIDEDGFTNMKMSGEDMGGLLGKTEVLSEFPIFEKFKIIDPTDEDADALIVE